MACVAWCGIGCQGLKPFCRVLVSLIPVSFGPFICFSENVLVFEITDMVPVDVKPQILVFKMMQFLRDRSARFHVAVTASYQAFLPNSKVFMAAC